MFERRSGIVWVFVLLVSACIVAGCGKSSKNAPMLPGLKVELTAGTPADQAVAADATASVMHVQLSTFLSTDVSVSTIRLSAQGTGYDEIDISSVEVYLDQIPYDTYTVGDTLLGSGIFDADDGKATISLAPAVLVSSGTPRNLIIRCTLNGNGPDGATYSFRIASSADISVAFVPGGPTFATGTPLSGATLTITSGGAKLNLLPGSNPPADTETLNVRDGVPVLQFSLYNRDSGTITVNSVTVTASGSGNDQANLWAANIYLDANSNGVVDAAEEPALATYTYAGDDSSTIVPVAASIAAGKRADFLITYDFSSAGTPAPPDKTFSALIAALADIDAEDAVPVSVTPTGSPPITGATITIVDRGTLMARLGSNNPAGAVVYAGSADIPVLQIELEAGILEDVTVTDLMLNASGTANDQIAISSVNVYNDANGNGQLDAGETPALGTGSYSADDGTVDLSGLAFTVGAGQIENLLVTYDLSPGGDMSLTFMAYVSAATDIQALGADSGKPITPQGTYPIESETFSILVPDTFISVSPLNMRRCHHAQVTFNDPTDGKWKVFVCGGYDGTTALDTVEIYDPALDTWALIATRMANPRVYHTATLLSDGRRILVAGGANDLNTTVGTHKDAEIFNPADSSFTPTSFPMNAFTGRQRHTATFTAGGDVLIYGGWDGTYGVEVTEYFNHNLDMFTMCVPGQYVRVFHTATRMSGGLIVHTGGLGYRVGIPGTSDLLNTIEAWSTSPIIMPQFLDPSIVLTSGRCGHVAVALPGDELLIAGGYADDVWGGIIPPFIGRKTAELFKDPSPNQGDETIEDIVDEMSEVRFLPVAMLLPNGKVLIAGGSNALAAVLDSAELYDPATQTFSDSSGTMSEARCGATWSMLPGPDGGLGTSDDMVLTVGGLRVYTGLPGPVQIANSADIYVP